MRGWAADLDSGSQAEPGPPDLTGGVTDRVGSQLSAHKLRNADDRFSASEPLLTVIVPVYNERATVDRLLEAVFRAPYSKQVVVVNDGSTDGSSELLRKWQQAERIELLTHAQNQGKGAAIRSGLACARGQFTIIQDADLEYDPQDYGRLIEPLLDREADAVYGSRRLGCKRTWHQLLNPFYHGVTVLNMCVRILYGVWITDEATCYKAFPTALLRAMDLTCRRFEFCPEVTAKACRMGLSIIEVPIRYTSRGMRDGKKIGSRDAIEAVRELWRWRTWQPVPAKIAKTDGQPNAITGDANAAESNIGSGASEVCVNEVRASRSR